MPGVDIETIDSGFIGVADETGVVEKLDGGTGYKVW